MHSRAGQGTLVAGWTAWGLSLVTIFLLNRHYDLPYLPAWLRAQFVALAIGPSIGTRGLCESLGGLLIAGVMVLAWWGFGDFILRVLRVSQTTAAAPPLGAFSLRCLYGAGAWSTIWFFLGVAHLYRAPIAIAALIIGIALAARSWLRDRGRLARLPSARRAPVALALLILVQTLALVAALAPPTANDTLLYHLALPKAYVAAGGMVDVPDNMASFYPLGGEMQSVWAMLLGHAWGARVAEAAATSALFAFAPLLVLTAYGWAREHGLDEHWASINALTIASIPTVYWVAANGYVDLALTAYTLLAVRAAGRWWTTHEPAWLMHLALAMGCALSIKLSAALLSLPLALLIFVRALGDQRAPEDRDARPRSPARSAIAGLLALAVGVALASPWYVRNWIRSGSPVFPFFPGLWPGEAPGWDVERARLYESLFLIYGRPGTLVDDLLAPVLVSLTAQPELPHYYDGVLGVAFLIGLPALAWALWSRRLKVELRIACLISFAMYVFWLFSSQQLRYLLPVAPALATAITASAAAAGERAGPNLCRTLRWLFVAAAAANALVIVGWFAEVAPIRVVLGGEPRTEYLSRRLDYYRYYEIINRELPPNANVWLIDMRRDTYHVERPYFADFIFEDYTLRQWLREAHDVNRLRARARAAGITHVLVRHDILLDYARSPIVNDALPHEQNLAQLRLAAAFFMEGTRLIRGDAKYWLIELPQTRDMDGVDFMPTNRSVLFGADFSGGISRLDA